MGAEAMAPARSHQKNEWLYQTWNLSEMVSSPLLHSSGGVASWPPFFHVCLAPAEVGLVLCAQMDQVVIDPAGLCGFCVPDKFKVLCPYLCREVKLHPHCHSDGNEVLAFII